MSKYRKKPVVIEATQWFKDGDHPAVTSIPPDHPIDRHAIDPGAHGWVETLEGGHIVTPGDWIITGVKGEHYPCKPDIFAATYEPASLPPEQDAQQPVAMADAIAAGDGTLHGAIDHWQTRALASEQAAQPSSLGAPAAPSGSPLQPPAEASASIPSAEALLADFCEASGTHFVEVYRPSAKTRQMVSNPIRRDDLLMLIRTARGMEAEGRDPQGLGSEGPTARPAGTRPEETAPQAEQAAQVQEPLTMDEIRRCYDVAHEGANVVGRLSDFSVRVVRAIERAHGIGVQLTKEGGDV